METKHSEKSSVVSQRRYTQLIRLCIHRTSIALLASVCLWAAGPCSISWVKVESRKRQNKLLETEGGTHTHTTRNSASSVRDLSQDDATHP